MRALLRLFVVCATAGLASAAFAAELPRLSGVYADGVYATVVGDTEGAECVQWSGGPICLDRSHKMLLSGCVESVWTSDDPDNPGTVVVNLRLSQRASEQLEDLTAANVGRRLAIVVDGAVVTAPRVWEPVAGGQFQIAGNLTLEQAGLIAVSLGTDDHMNSNNPQ